MLLRYSVLDVAAFDRPIGRRIAATGKRVERAELEEPFNLRGRSGFSFAMDYPRRLQRSRYGVTRRSRTAPTSSLMISWIRARSLFERVERPIRRTLLRPKIPIGTLRNLVPSFASGFLLPAACVFSRGKRNEKNKNRRTMSYDG